jgi:hypothetical protein
VSAGRGWLRRRWRPVLVGLSLLAIALGVILLLDARLPPAGTPTPGLAMPMPMASMAMGTPPAAGGPSRGGTAPGAP